MELKLTRENADALCTIITFGFFYSEGNRVIVQSEPQKDGSPKIDAEEYDKILDSYYKISQPCVRIYRDLSLHKEYLPYVLAKNPGDDDGIQAQKGLTNVTEFIEELFERIREYRMQPYGAYIGGRYDMNSKKVTIVGPSAMRQYSPVYRDITGEEEIEIETSFNNSKNSSITSWECLQRVNPFPGVELDPIDEAFDNGEPYLYGLFESYHGMVQAISKYPQPNNDVLFEIALGNSTTKVGACIPCSIFMFATGRLPSSVHLGRGDNWNIPYTCHPELREKWEKKVIEYFNAGISIFNSYSQPFKRIKFWQDYNYQTDFIPYMFLEALTFEDKFTEKIRKTLLC
jgi:hypothetical protein